MSKPGPKQKTPANTPGIASGDMWAGVVPPDLTPAGLAEWETRRAELESGGLLERTSPEVLRLYCVAYERGMQASAKIAAEGPCVKHTNGLIGAHPMLSVEASSAALQRRLLNDMGLTPATAKLRKTRERKAVESKWAGVLKIGS